MDLCNFEYLTPLLTLLICTPIALFLLMFRSSGSSRNKNLPPGNMGWPIIGECIDFALSHRSGKPESFVRTRMAKFPSARVFKTSLFGENMAVFCDAGGNKFLFSNENKIVSWWWPANIKKVLTFPTSNESEKDGSPDNDKVMKGARAFFIDYLQPESLRRYMPVMEAAAKCQAEELATKKEVMALDMIKHFAFSLSCKLFLRIEDPAHVARLAVPLKELTAGMVSLPVDFPGTTYHKAIKAGKEIQEEVLSIVTQRSKEVKAAVAEGRDVDMGDLLTKMLVNVDEDGKPLSHRQIAAMIIGLFLASHDTSSSALSCTLSYLADLPHIYDKVYEEQMEILKEKKDDETLSWDDLPKMKYTWNVVNEVLRLAPPAQGTFREILHDINFEGFAIPKGWKAYWSVHSTHKDPKYFPDPEKFEPARFDGAGPAPYTFVPFGGGPRMCPGRGFARVEVLTLLHHLVVNFRWRKVIPGEGVSYTTSAFPAKGLPIYLQPHCKK